MRIGPRGDRWFGDEFGPFILHTDADGRVLEPPIGLPGVASPDHPQPAAGSTPNLARSAGFEGMALSPDGRRLYPVLEGPLLRDPDPLRRWIYAYDLRRERFVGRRWQDRVEREGNRVSDFTALGADRFVVLERDGGEGAVPAFKRIFVVDLDRTDARASARCSTSMTYRSVRAVPARPSRRLRPLGPL
jgi:glycerophosphoryl diester phosphodiesterase